MRYHQHRAVDLSDHVSAGQKAWTRIINTSYKGGGQVLRPLSIFRFNRFRIGPAISQTSVVLLMNFNETLIGPLLRPVVMKKNSSLTFTRHNVFISTQFSLF